MTEPVRFNPPAQAAAPEQEAGFLEGLALAGSSTLQAATTEFVGFEPTAEVAKWRADNPWGSGISQFIGWTAPLVLAPELAFFKLPGLFRAIPLAGRLIKGAEVASRAQQPIRALAFREAGKLLPFEVGRVGLTAAINPDKTGQVAESAAFDLISIPVAYGAFGGLKKLITLPNRVAGYAQRVNRSFPDFDSNAPIQRQLDTVTRYLGELKGGTRTVARGTAEGGERDLLQLQDQLKILVKLEEPGSMQGIRQHGAKYIGDLAGRPTTTTSSLNNLFKAGDKGARGFIVRKLMKGEGGFGRKEADLFEEVTKDLFENFESSVQFPRHITAKSDEGASKLNKIFNESMGGNKASNYKWAREKDGGAYVFGIKTKGLSNKAAEGDQYMIFKTDRLGVHAPPGMRDAKKQLDATVFNYRIEASWRKSLDETRYISTLEGELGKFENVPIIGSAPEKRAAFLRLSKAAIPETLRKDLGTISAELGAVAGDMGKWMRQFVAPSLMQFSDNIMAQRLVGSVRLTFAEAQARVSSIMDGVPNVNLRAPISEVFWTGKRLGGLTKMIEESTEADVMAVRNHALRGGTMAEAEAGNMSEQSMNIIRTLAKLDAENVSEISVMHALAGKAKFIPRKDHFLISQTWTGTFRMNLMDADGQLVAVASGKTKKGVAAEAQDIIAEVKEATGQELTMALGKRRVLAKDLSADRTGRNSKALKPIGFEKAFDPRDAIYQIGPGIDDIEIARMLTSTEKNTASAIQRGRVRSLEQSPQFLKPRKGIISKTDVGYNKIDFLNDMRRTITTRETYKAQLALLGSPRFQTMLSTLAETNPQSFAQLKSRIDDFMGLKGPVVKTIENFIDSGLNKVMPGTTSASRIVRAVNRSMFNLMFMGDVGYAALNAMTFVQTALPEMAFILGAPTARLQKYYTWAMMPGAEGSRRIGGTLDMFKIMGRSFKEITKPNVDEVWMYERAMLDNTITPAFVAEHAGTHSERAASIKKLMKGDQSFPEFIMRMGEWLPAKSEELARVHAFTMGKIIGRDFLGATGDDLYRIAQEFTNRTMFLYAQSDRPRVMAGAVGGTFGLFKNWTAHYMGNMLGYAGEGVAHGNWKPLLWMMAGTGSIAGVGGLPFYGMVDSAAEALTDESAMEGLYRAFGTSDDTDVADALFYGLPALAGVSLQSRGAGPGANLGRDVGYLYSFAMMDRVNAGGRAIQTAIDYYEATGQNPIHNEKFKLNLMRFMLPRTMYRALSSAENFGIRSTRSGNLLVSEQSVAEAAIHISGFAPIRVDKLMTAHRMAFEEQEAMRTLKSTLGQAMAEAEEENDWDQMNKLFDSAASFGVADRVLASAKAHRRNRNLDLTERQFTDLQSATTRRILGVDR